MDILHIIILSIIQGVTEFLPISSSGHLIILPRIMNWHDQGLLIDVAMHIGTLMAVILYFHRETLNLLTGFRDIFTNRDSTGRTLFVNLTVATIPVIVAGLLLKNAIENDFRSALLVGTMSIVFGLVLYMADRKAELPHRRFESIIRSHAALIGLAQVLALVPGVSRSGITMTAALFLGYSRSTSARFSLLLSIPTTFAAGTLAVWEIIQKGNAQLTTDAFLAGIIAFAAGYLAIAGLMRLLKNSTFLPFVLYRLIFGIVLISMFI
jgi:undecaprenyl-diphosphatase